jgi:hypothetical protein
LKKTVAAIGASLLGVSGAAFAGAAPAAAAVPLPHCTNVNQHTVSANAISQPWYMDCIPQYGLGKAEFNITSTDPYPAGYSLLDGHQTITSSVNDVAAAAYLGVPESSLEGQFESLDGPQSPTATSQSYGGGASPTRGIFPIASVASLNPASLPAGTSGCFPNTVTPETYAHAYTVRFSPVTTTFKETIAGKVWTNVITATPQPLLLGLNFVASPGTGFDTTAALCASSGGTSLVADGNGSVNWGLVSEDEATLDMGFDGVNSLDPTANASTMLLGTFATTDPAVKTAVPVLAETGYDAAPAGLLSGGLLFGGIALLALRFVGSARRRARRS